MKLKNNSKRLGIFVFYDKDSIVDDYVLYMLDSLSKAVDDIIIVSNSYLPPSEMKKLNSYTDKIEIRLNVGLDAAAFKYVYDKYTSYITSFDELILLNDTFYGPFVPFKKIIKEMSLKDLDFWGLSKSYDSVDGYGNLKDEYMHSHIQTFFIAFRKNVLESSSFNDYWKNYDVKKMKSFIDVVTKHEIEFTHYLETSGFKWDTYVDFEHYHSLDKKKNFNMYAYSSYQLLKYFNCPFLKRKNLVFDRNDSLFLTSGIDGYKSLDYIKDKYDISLILKNLIRVYDIADIYAGLNLNYIVEENKKTNSKNLIIIDVEYSKYLNFLPTINHDMLLLTTDSNNSNKKIKLVDNVYKYICENRKKFMKKYDNICIIDMKNYYNDIPVISESNFFRMIDNSILNDEYINGISNILTNDSNLGVLLGPSSMHNKYISNINGYYFKKIYKEIRKLNLNINEKKFIPCNNNFAWFKSSILKNLPLTTLSTTGFITSLPYIAQKDLLYTGKVYSKDYIKNDLVNYEKIIGKLLPCTKLSYPNEILINSYNPDTFLKVLRRKLIPIRFRKKILDILNKNK
jgi:rhamnosyltransferase